MSNEFPLGSIADILNQPVTTRSRTNYTGDGMPYVHVSSLIKSHYSDQFCPREFVLNYFERRTGVTGSVPSKMQLLWDTGNIIGDKVVIARFIESSVEYGHLVWGDWRCLECDKLHTYQYRPETCECSAPSEKMVYSEVDLRIENPRLAAHPDLLIRLTDGTLIIYELKTIDRQDVVFSEINEPLGDHRMQASMYFYILRKMGYAVDRTLRFIYIDRSLDEMFRTSPFREIGSEVFSARRVQPLIDRAKVATEHIAKQRLPKRICNSIDDTRAKKCLRAVSCFSRRTDKITPMS